MKQPTNKLRRPISDLIERLQNLPPGTTFQDCEPILYGGERPDDDLGTSYQLVIDICEGFNPPREDADADTPIIVDENQKILTGFLRLQSFQMMCHEEDEE